MRPLKLELSICRSYNHTERGFTSDRKFTEKREFNQLVGNNHGKEEMLKKLSFEAEMMRGRKFGRDLKRVERKKLGEVEELLLGAIEERRALAAMKNKEKQRIRLLTEKVERVSSVLRKFEGIFRKSKVTCELAVRRHEEVVWKENFVEKEILKKRRKFYRVFNVKKQGRAEEVIRIHGISENITDIHRVIGENFNKRKSLVQNLNEVIERNSEWREESMRMKGKTNEIERELESLGGLLARIGYSALHLDNFSPDVIINAFIALESEESSLCRLFQDLTLQYIARQKQYEKFEHKVEKYKNEDILVNHSYEPILKNRENPKEWENKVLNMYLGILNTIFTFFQQLTFIDHQASVTSRVSINIVNIGERIKDLTKGFHRKKQQLKGVRLSLLQNSRNTDNETNSLSYSLSQTAIYKIHKAIFRSKSEANKFSTTIKQCAFMCSFIDHDYLYQYLKSKLSRSQMNETIPELLKHSHSVFQKQTQSIIQDFIESCNYILEHSDSLKEKIYGAGNGKYTRFNTLRKKTALPTISQPSKGFSPRSVDTSLMKEQIYEIYKNSKRQLKKEVGQMKKPGQLDVFSPRQVLEEFIEIDRKIGKIKCEERKTIGVSRSLEKHKVNSPWNNQSITKIEVNPFTRRLRQVNTLVNSNQLL